MATKTLRDKQCEFTLMVASLITWSYANDYEVSFGEAWRPPETAELYAKDGRGIANSLHTLRLAIDLNFFRNGLWLKKTEELLPIGQKWRSLGGSWGGDFTKPDGNHFSLEHEGVR
jgi:hypothetical protein